jgi:hypothetical protein
VRRHAALLGLAIRRLFAAFFLFVLGLLVAGGVTWAIQLFAPDVVGAVVGILAACAVVAVTFRTYRNTRREGRAVAVTRARTAEEKKRRRWESPAQAQQGAVERLTAELENATLVRTIEDGAAEVLGVRRGVAYRYRVDRSGNVDLVSVDDSKATLGRWSGRMAGVGVSLFVGSLIATFAINSDGSVPPYLVPPAIVGFGLALLGGAANVQPTSFLSVGERWQEVGKAWESGDGGPD